MARRYLDGRERLFAAQGDASSADQARRLLRIAHDHLALGRVSLTLVGGLPGTGKSTLAGGLADRLGWTVLRSDEIRKDLAGTGHATRLPVEYGEGLYDERATAATYRALLDRARFLLELGESVILDASWSESHWRNDAVTLARETTSDLVEVRCEAPIEVTRQRIAARARSGRDASDATVEIAARMAATVDPWPTAETIDTSSLPAVAVDACIAVLQSTNDLSA